MSGKEQIELGCPRCMHKEVCEYLLAHEKEVEEARKFFSKCSSLTPIVVRCRYFREEVPVPRTPWKIERGLK